MKLELFLILIFFIGQCLVIITNKTHPPFEPIVDSSQKVNLFDEAKPIPAHTPKELTHNEIRKILMSNDHSSNKGSTITNPTRLKDYFTKTSEQNQNAAAQALTSFVVGIVLFMISIQVVCWNERRAVKDTEMLDYYLDTNRSSYVEGSGDFKHDENLKDHLLMLTGKVSVKDEASIENSIIRIKNIEGKVALIKIFHEYLTIDITRDSDGHEIINKKWVSKSNIIPSNYSIRKANLYISDRYNFDTVLLDHIITSPDNHYMNNDIQTHIPKENEFKEIQEWLRPGIDGHFIMETDSQGYIYAVQTHQHNQNPASTTYFVDHFNPINYHFREKDERLIIKYVSVL
jgi:hypothetical protein